jgi:signal transduction histidine kinase
MKPRRTAKLKETRPVEDHSTSVALPERLARRERELEVLSRVASRIHGEETVETILDIALEEILQRLEVPAGWVILGSEGEPALRLAAARGVAPAYLEEVRARGLETCLCREVFEKGQRMLARNTTECPRMPMIVDGLRAPVAHACIPLRFEGMSRGVLNIAARPGERFSEDELRFLETLGYQICLAVERARHRQAERRYNQRALALASLNKSIGGSLDATAVLRAVGSTAREVLEVDRVHVLLGTDPRAMRLAHLSGVPDREFTEGRAVDVTALASEGMVRTIESGASFVVHDAAADPRVIGQVWRRWNVRAALFLPLRTRDRSLGFMALGRTRPHRWSPDQIEVAEALAAQAAVALDSARLYEETRQAYRGLQDAQARIIQTEKLAVVGTFASGLAHEVRNPLNSMALQLSILERRIASLDTDVSDQMRDLTVVIRQEIKRLDSLVGDFLMFARTNRVQFRLGSLDALLDEVVHLLRPEARTASVTLRRERKGDPIPDIRMDSEKIKQVVINLVRNAIEAMPDGGTATVESGLVDGHALVVVRDTGPGIPANVDVFQVFVTTKAKGTGLGLSIAQQIVLEHGGEIDATNDAAGGAVLSIKLPVAQEEGQAP